MKKITFLILCLIFYSCSKESTEKFSIDPLKPVEVGLASLIKKSLSNYYFDIYIINHRPVSGMQFELNPSNIFTIDSVSVLRERLSKDDDFSVHNNESGTILMFSMTGKKIKESESNMKINNTLLRVHMHQKNEEINLPDSVWVKSIIADAKGQKIESNSIPYHLGK